MLLRLRHVKKEIVRPLGRALTRNLVDYKYVISLIETNVLAPLIENRKIPLLGGHVSSSKSLDVMTSFERVTEAISEEEEEEEEADDKALGEDVVMGEG